MGWQDEAVPVTSWQDEAIPDDGPTTVQGMPLDTSPLDPPPERKFSAVTREGPISRVIPPNEDLVDAAARGVDYQTGIDGGLREDIGYSPGDAFTHDYLATKLAEKYGTEKAGLVRQNASGEFEYYNKDLQRYALIDEAGLSTSDLKDMYGPAKTVGLEIAGAIGGAFAGPWTSVAGGSVGAFMGEYMRLNKGKSLGVHDLSWDEMFDEAAGIAGLSAAAGAGGEVASFALNRLRLIISPEGFSVEEAERMLSAFRSPELQSEIREINRALDGNRYKLDMASASGHETDLALKDTAMKSDAGFKADMGAQARDNDDALASYLERQTGADDIRDPMLPESSGTEVQAGLRAHRREIEERYANNSAVAKEESDRVLRDLPDLDETAGGKQAREIADAHATTLKNQKTASYKAYEGTIGQKKDTLTSNVDVPISSRVVARQKEIDALIDASIIDKQTSGTNALRSSRIKPEVIVDETPIIGVDGLPARPTRIFERGRNVDLAVLDDNIKTLRAGIRRSQKGGGPAEFNEQKAMVVVELLSEMRNEYLEKNYPEAFAALTKAELDNTVYKNFVGKSALKSILRTGDNAIEDITVFKQVFEQNNAAAMRQLVIAADEIPGARAKLQQTMLEFYKANYLDDYGVLDRKLHDRFIKRHGNVLRELFPDDNRIATFGQLARRVEVAVKKEQAVVKALDGTVLGRMSRQGGKGVAPEDLGQHIFVKGVSNKDIRRVTLIIKAAPNSAALNKSWRESVGSNIFNKITNKDGAIKITELGNLLDDHGQTIIEAMGDRYKRDLELLYKYAVKNQESSGGVALEKTHLLGRFLRATPVSPPLSQRGRFQTFVQQIRWNASNTALVAGLRDPQVLRAIIYNAERDIRDKNVIRILTQTGATGLAIDDDGLLPPEYRSAQ